MKGLKLRYYKFNKKYSLKYYYNEKFRKSIQSEIPSNKLSINLSECHQIKDVSMLGRLYTLNLTGCNKITDISMLGNVKELIR